MAGEVKLAIILSASMQGSQAFTQAGGGIKGIGAAAKAAVPMLAMFAAHAAFGFLKDSIDTAMKFEQVMAEAGSIVGKTGDQMRETADAIREMSQEIPKSSTDLGIALYDIYSAGITDSKEALDALKLSAMAASAGLTETKTAAQAGISTMNAFGMQATDLSHIFDTQFLTIKYGILRYEELAGVIGDVAPSAKNAGQSMESMFATIAILTKKGLNAATAATSLARAMDAITKPEAIRAATELGISFIDLSPAAITLRDNFLSQKRALDDLTGSYLQTEAQVKSLGEEMAKVSLEEAKNRLEISKIKRDAEKQGRELTDAELASIAAMESANADLRIQYDELSVSQQAAQIQGTELNNQLAAQKVLTEDATKAFDEEVAATGNLRPLVDIVQEIGDKYGDLGEAARADIISQMFPEIRARKAILGIMGSEAELIAITNEMTDTAGAMGEAYAINTDTAATSSQLMKNSMEDLKIQIGEDLMPTMEMFHEILRDNIIPMIQESFIPILQASMPVIQALAEAVGFLAGLFADYPELLWAIIGAIVVWKTITMAAAIVQGIQTAATWLSTAAIWASTAAIYLQVIAIKLSTAATWLFNSALLANPLVWVVILIVALIAALYLLWKHWDDVTAALSKVWDAMKGVGEYIMGGLKAAFDWIVGGIGFLIDGLKWLWDVIVAVGKIFFDVWLMSFKIPLDLIVGGVNLIIDALQWLWDMIVKVGKVFQDTFGFIVDTIGGVGGFLGDIGGGIGGFLGFAEGGVVTSPTLGLLGESGAEAVIPLKNGSVPVDFGGSAGGGDNYTININTGVLPQQETPDSLANKVAVALTNAKKRGATGQVM